MNTPNITSDIVDKVVEIIIYHGFSSFKNSTLHKEVFAVLNGHGIKTDTRKDIDNIIFHPYSEDYHQGDKYKRYIFESFIKGYNIEKHNGLYISSCDIREASKQAYKKIMGKGEDIDLLKVK